MPKASIHEHGQSEFREVEVRLAGNAAWVRLPAFDLVTTQPIRDRALCRGVPPPSDLGHVPRPLTRRKDVLAGGYLSHNNLSTPSLVAASCAILRKSSS